MQIVFQYLESVIIASVEHISFNAIFDIIIIVDVDAVVGTGIPTFE